MPDGEQSNQRPELPQPASQAGPEILDICRAARIGDVTAFANCLVKTADSCPNGLVSGSFHYFVHPHREVIIARTLAADLPPGT